MFNPARLVESVSVFYTNEDTKIFLLPVGKFRDFRYTRPWALVVGIYMPTDGWYFWTLHHGMPKNVPVCENSTLGFHTWTYLECKRCLSLYTALFLEFLCFPLKQVKLGVFDSEMKIKMFC